MNLQQNQRFFKKLAGLASLLIIVIVLGARVSKKTYAFKFQDPSLPVDTRVNDLVAQLTLDEKVGQMLNAAPAVDRLKIPAYNWWNECLHGVARTKFKVTAYPQAIAMAATLIKARCTRWRPTLPRKAVPLITKACAITSMAFIPA